MYRCSGAIGARVQLLMPHPVALPCPRARTKYVVTGSAEVDQVNDWIVPLTAQEYQCRFYYMDCILKTVRLIHRYITACLHAPTTKCRFGSENVGGGMTPRPPPPPILLPMIEFTIIYAFINSVRLTKLQNVKASPTNCPLLLYLSTSSMVRANSESSEPHCFSPPCPVNT